MVTESEILELALRHKVSSDRVRKIVEELGLAIGPQRRYTYARPQPRSRASVDMDELFDRLGQLMEDRDNNVYRTGFHAGVDFADSRKSRGENSKTPLETAHDIINEKPLAVQAVISALESAGIYVPHPHAFLQALHQRGWRLEWMKEED